MHNSYGHKRIVLKCIVISMFILILTILLSDMFSKKLDDVIPIHIVIGVANVFGTIICKVLCSIHLFLIEAFFYELMRYNQVKKTDKKQLIGD